MIILSDALTEKNDEGCLKVASSLVKRIRKEKEDTTVISYERRFNDSDEFLDLNKLFLNRKLFSFISKNEGDILYIPFSSNTLASVIRSIILSVFSRRKVYTLFALCHPMNKLSKLFLKMSKTTVIALSKKSYDFYKNIVGDKVVYLKTGVDTNRFCEVQSEKKIELRKKYGFNENEKIILHIGHINKGRNVKVLNDISKDKKVILVVSSAFHQDEEIRSQLEKNENILIIDEYISSVEEIYQLADVYLFPVQSDESCIDVPLSVLEAASCGIPVVATKYGELKELQGQKGFYFLDSVEPDKLNIAIEKAIKENVSPRKSILQYDWDNSVNYLEEMMLK